MSKKILFLTLSILGTFAFLQANHSWNNYHFARISNPFTLKLGDNLTTNWKSYLQTTKNDWSLSSILDLTIVKGANKKNCGPVSGRVEVCNARYGNNGWLGIASIWAQGEHITQGTVKMNDTYYNTATYNTPAWRNLVMCQEVGHTLGLDHQDETFSNANLDTCMDYTNDPTSNQHPNAHDYEMLDTIYTHLDTFTTLSASTQNTINQDAELEDIPKNWGKEIKRSKDGGLSVYEKDFGNGLKRITHVYWVKDRKHE